MKEENSRSTGFFVMALMFGLFSAAFFVMCRPGAGIVWLMGSLMETAAAVIERKKRRAMLKKVFFILCLIFMALTTVSSVGLLINGGSPAGLIIDLIMVCAAGMGTCQAAALEKRDREQNNKGDKTDGDRDRCEEP